MCFAFPSSAQEAEKMPELSRFNFKVNVAIPTILGNKALRNSFRGIYEGEANFQTRLFNGLYIGLSGSYTGFKISSGGEFYSLNTECRTSNASLNISYEKFSTPRVMWYANLGYGYNWINYYRVPSFDSLTIHPHSLAWSIKPALGFSYYSDDNFSIGMFAAYTFQTNEFHPQDINLQKFAVYKRNDMKGFTNYLSIGIILNFNIRKELFENSSSFEEEDATQ